MASINAACVVVFRIEPMLELLQGFLLGPVDIEGPGGVMKAANRPFRGLFHRPEQPGASGKQGIRHSQIGC